MVCFPKLLARYRPYILNESARLVTGCLGSICKQKHVLSRRSLLDPAYNASPAFLVRTYDQNMKKLNANFAQGIDQVPAKFLKIGKFTKSTLFPPLFLMALEFFFLRPD